MTQRLASPQYDSFVAVRSHVHSNGLAMMATAGLFPQAAQVVALNGGLDYDVIAYSASRRGAPPDMFSPKTTNRNRVFLNGGRTGNFTYNDMAGVRTYHGGGFLVFGILSPEGLASDFMLGTLPFPGLDKNEQIPGSYFSYQLINQLQTQVLISVPTMPPLLNAIVSKG